MLRFATFSNRASSHYELGAKSQSLQYQTFKSKLTSAFATAEINKKLGILIFVVSTDFNFLIVSYKAWGRRARSSRGTKLSSIPVVETCAGALLCPDTESAISPKSLHILINEFLLWKNVPYIGIFLLATFVKNEVLSQKNKIFTGIFIKKNFSWDHFLKWNNITKILQIWKIPLKKLR